VDLEDLLIELFEGPDELRAFTRRGDTRALINGIRWGRSHALVCHELAHRLDSNRYADRDLFERLLASAPRRAAEISRVAARYGVGDLGVGPVLCAAAVATDSSPLSRAAIELRDIESTWRAAGRRVRVMPAARLRDLIAVFPGDAPSVLHFSGHGEREQLLVLGDDDRAVPLTLPTLRALVGAAWTPPALVVLNACMTAETAHAVASADTWAIGARSFLDDDAAKDFAAHLHERLAAAPALHPALPAAFAAAREAARRGGRRGDYQLFTA